MAREKLTGNMLIAQSGGPTAVINQSLVGAVLEAKKHKAIKKIYGSLHGLKGILGEDLCDLRFGYGLRFRFPADLPIEDLGDIGVVANQDEHRR